MSRAAGARARGQTRWTGSHRRTLALGLAMTLAGATLVGCVRTDRTRRPQATTTERNRPASNAHGGGAQGLPSVARPAPGRSLTTRVRVSILPVGTVESDGSVLPLVSPDGRFIASQVGDSPSWEALLAAPNAQPALWTSVRAYMLRVGEPAAAQPGKASIEPIEFGEALPEGLMLGRSADTAGFLVEQERPDGSRWVGRVAWASGRLTWLSRGAVRDRHALMTGDGRVLCVRREADGAGIAREALVLLGPDGSAAPLTLSTSAPLMPVVGLQGQLGVIAGIERAAEGGPTGARELELIEVREAPGRLAVFARRRLGVTGGVPEAFQMVAGVQAPPPGEASGASGRGGVAPGFLLFHPGRGRMMVLSPGGGGGGVVDLPPGSISACPVSGDGQGTWGMSPGALGEAGGTVGGASGIPEGGGWLVTRVTGLAFVPPEGGAEGAEISEAPFVGRLTGLGVRPWVLLGPPHGGERNGVGVVLLGLGTGGS